MTFHNPRLTRHVVLQTSGGPTFIISSLSTREDTQVISIDPFTGTLCYSARAGIDLFRNEETAVKALLSQGHKIQNKFEGNAILGYARVTNTGHLLLATKIRADLRYPGGHIVYTVLETTWVHITLQYGETIMQPTHKKIVDLICGFQVNDTHFFCETYDMTRPFPSEHSPLDFDPEFCFNGWLASPFAEAGLRAWCVVLLQGAAISRLCNLPGIEAHLSLVTRKSRLNAGTRFYARGLNEQGGSGNECETQQLLWYESKGTTRFVSQIYRRGTVPLWWRSELRSTVGESETVISDRPYEGVHLYWQTIQERYPNASVTCLNLLRTDPDRQEILLSQHFHESIGRAASIVKMPVRIVNFDWHQHSKMLGMPETVRLLWSKLASVLPNQTLGGGEFVTSDVTLSEAPQEHTNANHSNGKTNGTSATSVPEERTPQLQRVYLQQSIMRLNCADSLDRTNVAAFYIAMQVTLEMCRLVRIPVNIAPPSAEPWSWLQSPLEVIVKAIPEPLLVALAEMFVRTGDVLSTLYTNTSATMSTAIRAYAPSLAKPPYDATIAIQRRYQNFMRDEQRQMQYDAFLGTKGYRDACRPPPRLLSSYPAQLLVDIPHHPSWESPEPSALLSDPEVCWVLPPGTTAVVLKIWLGQRCLVEELALTIRHGTCDAMAPQFCDVLVGDSLKDSRAVLQDVTLPRCPDGSTIYLTLRDISPTPLYHFYDTSRRSGVLCRAVYVVLRGVPFACAMTIGRVAVLGSLDCGETHLGAAKRKLANLLGEEPPSPPQLPTADFHSLFPAVPTSLPGDQLTPENMQSPQSMATLFTRSGSPVEHAELTAEPVLVALTPGSPDTVDVRLEVTTSPAAVPRAEGANQEVENTANSGCEEEEPATASIHEEADEDVDATDATENVQLYKDTVRRTIASFQSIVTQACEAEDPPLPSTVNSATPSALSTSQRPTSPSHSAPFRIVNLDLTTALQLEEERAKLRLTPAARDEALLSLRLVIDCFNPNRYIRHHDFTVQASQWQPAGSGRCERCQQQATHVRPCHYCSLRTCNHCLSAAPQKIIEYSWTDLHTVCQVCADLIVKQQSIIEKVSAADKVLLTPTRKRDNQQVIALAQFLATNVTYSRPFSSSTPFSVSNMPDASVLSTTNVSQTAVPVEFLLLPDGVVSSRCAWTVPGSDSITVVAQLAQSTSIKQLTVVADSEGYGRMDAPVISIQTGDTVSDAQPIATWCLSQCAGNTPQHYVFERTVHGRVLVLVFSPPAYQLAQDTRVATDKQSTDDTTPPSLRVGRLQILGAPARSLRKGEVKPFSAQKLRMQLDSVAAVTRLLLRPLLVSYRDDNRVLDIAFPTTKVYGFEYNISSADEYASALIGVSSAVLETGKPAQNVQNLGQFLIPKARQGPLVFEFPSPIECNLMSFQALRLKGGARSFGRDPSPDKIRLFAL